MPEPIALCAEKHREYGYLPKDRKSQYNPTYAPIALFEFPAASQFYPILFLAKDVLTPIAITGSLQIAKHDASISATTGELPYLPLVQRIHPFFLQKLPEKDNGILLFDNSAHQIVQTSQHKHAVALFSQEGQPTDFLKQIGKNAADFYTGQGLAVQFSQALHKSGLLTPSVLELTPPDNNGPTSSEKLYTINEIALRALRGETVVEWFRNGFLDAAILAALSQRHWQQSLQSSRL